MKKSKVIATLIMKLLQQGLTPFECSQADRWRQRSAAHNDKFLDLLNTAGLKESVDLLRAIDADQAWEKFRQRNGLPDKTEKTDKRPGLPSRNAVGSRKARLESLTCLESHF